MAWQKSSPELVERFSRVVGRFPDVTQRKMFGYPAGFVGGNMVTSLFEESWVVRLEPDGLEEARATGGTAFDPMGGRPMKGYVTLPPEVLADEDAVAGWVERAIAHGRTMPPKKK